ncbi:hypothetical protein AVEN_259386-1 [Araneus ventricosus]|uniref:Uncharacterized protein n=1 Tax=Araneus ventricosus TaxID=182803 RepID=A0A4Y2DRN7_ARAVE|nr:hypothetical protein AVEN_259386-1 [Araneus ventricosus]
MKDLVSAVVKLQDHLAQSIGSEMLYPDSFARLVHNGLVLHPAGTTLPAGCVWERRSTSLAAPVAETGETSWRIPHDENNPFESFPGLVEHHKDANVHPSVLAMSWSGIA